jgi:hypothetical protein
MKVKLSKQEGEQENEEMMDEEFDSYPVCFFSFKTKRNMFPF